MTPTRTTTEPAVTPSPFTPAEPDWEAAARARAVVGFRFRCPNRRLAWAVFWRARAAARSGGAPDRLTWPAPLAGRAALLAAVVDADGVLAWPALYAYAVPRTRATEYRCAVWLVGRPGPDRAKDNLDVLRRPGVTDNHARVVLCAHARHYPGSAVSESDVVWPRAAPPLAAPLGLADGACLPYAPYDLAERMAAADFDAWAAATTHPGLPKGLRAAAAAAAARIGGVEMIAAAKVI